MRVHLIDGTYELYRHFFALPAAQDRDGHEVGAVRGVLASVLGMLEGGTTHVGVATDHVVESFRNRLWAGYKTGEGIDPLLHSQFHPLEQTLASMGVVVWAMQEFEADDALASAAARAAGDSNVEQILICSPDKDLSQCVVGDRIVQFDRRQRQVRNEAGVIEKFGVPPVSIPDWLALVGDTADGFPGVTGWGEKAATALLARYGRVDRIPVDCETWEVTVRGAARLGAAFAAQRDLALLFRELATLRLDAPVFDFVDELRWQGPTTGFQETAARLGAPELWERANRIR